MPLTIGVVWMWMRFEVENRALMMKVVYLMLKRGGGAGALLQGEEPTYFGNDGSREYGG